MALIKVIIQEERTRYPSATAPNTVNASANDDITYWETMHEMTSTDPGVVAGTLRAIADKYAPPKVTYRGTE